MPKQIIRKPATADGPGPNLVSYEQARAAFSWEQARRELSGLPGGRGLNIAHEAVDRHAEGGLADRDALRCIGAGGHRREFTFAQLRALTNRFANALRTLGVGRGERLYTLTGRIPELYIAALGALKNGSVYCPLFSAFGPEPIQSRMAIGAAKVLVTTRALYERKVAPVREMLPALEHVILVDGGGDGTHDFHELVGNAAEDFSIAATDPEDMALLHFTSGTTGKPKGAVHVHDAVVAHFVTGRLALDMRPGDVYWCTADPGWVTGTSYGIIAPLVNGVTTIIDEQEFDAERWYRILSDEKVNIWYTAPTAVRMMMKYGAELAHRYDTRALRFMASVGEPLNAEAVLWSDEVFGRPFHDNWWQTETGGIMIANYAAMDIKPGSMGRPMPGIEAAVVTESEDGRLQEMSGANVQGELALRPGWPSMFRGYLGDDERYRACFRDGWYLTGDLARRDRDGYFWFVGRTDDVIKSAGHLIGPFEVESVLMEHSAVAEAGVIGVPDPVAGEVVKAFVTLKPGVQAGEALQRELLAHARRRLGPAVAPRRVEFRQALPKNRSGKIVRRILKARELGTPEGDVSTLEVQ
jgi:acetyl-CoA synthetase